MENRARTVVCAVGIVALLMMTASAHAGTRTWDGGAATDSWHDGANWSPDGVPGPADDVSISGVATPVVYSAGSSTIASLNASNSMKLTISGGSIEVLGAFDVISTDFDYLGGMIVGTPVVRTAAIFVGAGVTAPSQIIATGACDLLGNESAMTEVWVRGQNATGNALLSINADAVNAGTIRMESIEQGWASDLTIASGQTLTNTGAIEAKLGTGGQRTVSGLGTLRNEAPITADTLMLIQPTAYVHAAGEWLGEVQARDTMIDIQATATTPTTILVVGSGCSLLGSDSLETEIWVRGQNIENANLTIPTDLTNVGAIRLESIDQGWASDLTVASGQTLTNLGTIEAKLGSGGGRNIAGDAVLDNQGDIVVEAGSNLVIPDPLGVFSQNAGSVVGNGPFIVRTGALNHVGGTLVGEVWADDASILVGPGVVSPSQIVATGACDLLGNESSVTEIWVRGQNATGNANLTIPTDLANAGTIRMESIDQGWASDLTITSGQTLTNLGTIEAKLGTGGQRTVSGLGTLRNEATITADTLMLIQPTAYVHAAGEWLGEVQARDTMIDIQATATTPTTILVVGSGCSLLGSDSLETEIWVRGQDATGSANLTIPAHLTNAGTIRLESINQAWASNLTIASGQTLTNLGTIESKLGTGGGRNIAGDAVLDNQGDIMVEAGIDLVMPDALGVFNQNAGSVVGNGPFVVRTGTLNHLGGALAGEVWADNASMFVGSGVVSPSQVVAAGACDLLGNESAMTEVWVRGQNETGNANLTVPADMTNVGTIRMESIEQGWASDLTIASGQTLTNTGAIEAKLGTGGQRTVSGLGTLRNEAPITADTLMLIQPAAYVHAAGEWLGEVQAQNTVIDIEATATTPTTILVAGSGCSLLGSDSAETEIWVRGQNSISANLMIPASLTNYGTIRLESIDQGWASNLTVASGQTLTNLGTIESKLGTGGPRTITGDLINGGTLDAGYPASIVLNGNYTQTSSGVFITEFAGETNGTHTFLDVNGDAHLDGAITIARVDGFAPAPGTNIDVLTADLIIGAFNETLSCDPITVSHDGIDVTVTFGAITGILGDLTGDGEVNINDLLLLLGGWGPCPKGGPIDCCPGDLNEDGVVDVLDLLLMLGNWS